MPQNNCIVENRIGDELRGVRSQLLQAGFPHCLWPYAARVCATLENVRVRADGTSPWQSRFGDRPDFLEIPLGCKVWFTPAPTIYEQAKAAPRLTVGIFMGYRMAPGGKFGGQYVIVDLDDFKGVSLDLKTRHTKFKFHEHHVEKVLLPITRTGSKFVFPMKDTYDRANDSIEGRDSRARAAAEAIPDEGDPPPLSRRPR